MKWRSAVIKGYLRYYTPLYKATTCKANVEPLEKFPDCWNDLMHPYFVHKHFTYWAQKPWMVVAGLL